MRRTRRGKVVAISTAAAGVVVLVAAGVAAWPQIREQHYIQQLRSSDEETRLAAADALADARSARSVPYLIALLKHELREETCHWFGPGGTSVAMTPLAFALYRIGKGALPNLGQATEIEEQRILEEEGSVHYSSDDYLGILNEIRRAIDSPDQIVRREPYDSHMWKWHGK